MDCKTEKLGFPGNLVIRTEVWDVSLEDRRYLRSLWLSGWYLLEAKGVVDVQDEEYSYKNWIILSFIYINHLPNTTIPDDAK